MKKFLCFLIVCKCAVISSLALNAFAASAPITLDNTPTLNTTQLELSGTINTAAPQTLQITAKMPDRSSWQSTQIVDSSEFTITLSPEDFAHVSGTAMSVPLSFAYLAILDVQVQDSSDTAVENLAINWINGLNQQFPWQKQPLPITVNGRTMYPGLHINNAGHFGWRYEPNGLLINNITFDYLERDYTSGPARFRLNFGIPNAIVAEITQEAVEEGLGITGLVGRVDYQGDQEQYLIDDVDADWTSFKWRRLMETQDGQQYYQELRYSILASGVQIETDSPQFALSYQPHDLPGNVVDTHFPVNVLADQPEDDTAKAPATVMVPIASDNCSVFQVDQTEPLLNAAQSAGMMLLIPSSDLPFVPVLVVFQHQPDSISWQSNQLVIERQDGIGTLAISTPFGAEAITSETFAEQLQDTSTFYQRITQAAEVIMAYPWSCQEFFAVEDDHVVITQNVQSWPWQDDWNRTARSFNPLPPLISYSVLEGYLDESCIDNLQDLNIPTKWGPYWGCFADSQTYRLPIPDAWDCFPLHTQPDNQTASIYQNLRTSLTHQNARGFGQGTPTPTYYPHCSTVDHSAGVLRASNFLDTDSRLQLYQDINRSVLVGLFPQNYVLRSDPITGACYRGSTFAWRPDNGVNVDGAVDVDYWQGLSMYGIYSVAKYTGNWEMVQEHWSCVNIMLSYWQATNSWALMSPGARDAGEMYHADMPAGGYAGLAGYYYMAQQVGNDYEKQLAAYLLAKAAVPTATKLGFYRWAQRIDLKDARPEAFSTGYGERWVAAYPYATPTIRDSAAGSPWWLTGAIGPLGAQMEYLDLLLKRCPEDASHAEGYYRDICPNDQMVSHDTRHTYPHMLLRSLLGGDWHQDAIDWHTADRRIIMFREIHTAAAIMGAYAPVRLIDWTPGYITNAQWSNLDQKATIDITAPNQPAILKLLVDQSITTILVDQQPINFEFQESFRNYNLVEITIRQGSHTVELHKAHNAQRAAVTFFQDDCDSDLSNWRLQAHDEATVQIDNDLAVNNGAIVLRPANSSAAITSMYSFSDPGIYHISFDMNYDVRDYNDGQRVKVHLPGGISLAPKGWNNGFFIRYKGQNIAEIPGGHHSQWAHYDIIQDQAELRILRNQQVIFQTFLTSVPDYQAGHGVMRFSVRMDSANTYLALDNVNVQYYPQGN